MKKGKELQLTEIVVKTKQFISIKCSILNLPFHRHHNNTLWHFMCVLGMLASWLAWHWVETVTLRVFVSYYKQSAGIINFINPTRGDFVFNQSEFLLTFVVLANHIMYNGIFTRNFICSCTSHLQNSVQVNFSLYCAKLMHNVCGIFLYNLLAAICNLSPFHENISF